MKKITKRVLAVVLLGVMMFSLCACGVDMNKIKGDWKIKTINGKDIAGYFQESQTFAAVGLTITDKEITRETKTIDGNVETKKLEVVVRSNGIEGKDGDNVVMALVFDEKAGTLTQTSTDQTVVFEKGKADLDAIWSSIFGGSEDEGYDESYDEGAEEE